MCERESPGAFFTWLSHAKHGEILNLQLDFPPLPSRKIPPNPKTENKLTAQKNNFTTLQKPISFKVVLNVKCILARTK